MKTATPASRPSEVRFTAPPVNIRATDDGYLLEAEMPGVNKQGLEVLVEGSQLTLTGHRSDPAQPGEPVYREARRADFRRVFEVDPSIDTARIAARIEDGLVTVTLPKAEAVKPRKIKIA